MAIYWGAWSGYSRLGIEITRTSQTATAETFRLDVYLGLNGWVADNYNTLHITGSFSWSGSVPVNSGRTSALKLHSMSKTFSRRIGQTSPGRVSVSLAEFSGGSPSVSAAFTVSAQPYQPPGLPRNVSASINGRQATVRFLQQATAIAPVTGFDINQQTWPAGGTVLVGQPGAARTSWTSAQLAAGREYRFLVRQRGAGGNGAWAYTNWVQTPPVQVANVTATRAGGGTIVVAWRAMSNYRPGTSTFIVFRNGTRVASGVKGTTWTDKTPPPGDLTYSVAEVNGHGLVGRAGVALAVNVLAPPYAPTNLNPSGGYLPAGEQVRLEWVHVTKDGTSQQAYRVRYRFDGGQWAQAAGETNQFHVLAVDVLNGARTVEWQVQTRGGHANFGDWSPVARFNIAARPTVEITAPTATIISNTTTVRLTTGDKSREYSWRVSAYVNDQFHGEHSGHGVQPYEWTVIDLPNNSTLRVEAIVYGEVPSLTVKRSVRVEYQAPPTPTVTAAWIQATGAVSLAVSNPDVDTGVAAAYNRVQRREPGGQWVTVGDQIPVDGSFTDPIPPTNTPVEYRAVAVASSGAAAYGEPSRPVGELEPGVFVNWGQDWAQVLRLVYNPEVGYTPGLAEAELVYFAGHTVPTLLAGPQTSLVAKYEGTLIDDEDEDAARQALRVRQVGLHAGLVTVRHPEQPPTTGTVSGMSVNRTHVGRYDISFTHTRAQ